MPISLFPLDIRVGDYVFVEKGGEIIPKITGVDFSKRPPSSQPFTFIEYCPECGTPLRKNPVKLHGIALMKRVVLRK